MNRRQKIAIALGALVIGVLGLALLALELELHVSDVMRAEVRMAFLGCRVDRYRAVHGELPPSLQDRAESDELWQAFFRAGDHDDFWGRPYQYVVLSVTEYELRSGGEDGEFGTDDDLVWPHAQCAVPADAGEDPSTGISLSALIVRAMLGVLAVTAVAVCLLKDRKA